jgi:type IV pilus assembly protein PilA
VDREDGFTLVELLVVVLIIAILMAIGIPAFVKQREKAYVTQVKSALREGATAAEASVTNSGGNYSALTLAELQSQGYKVSSGISVSITATSTTYCLTASHSLLAAPNPWKTGTYDSDDGRFTDSDTC